MLDSGASDAVSKRMEFHPKLPEIDQSRSLLERARWRAFADGLPWAIAGGLGAGLVVSVAIASISDLARPASWFAALLTVTVLRCALAKRYAKPAILSRSPGYARGMLYAGNAMSGLVWGAGSFWMIVANQDLIVSVLFSFCAAGVSAAAAASFSAVAWGVLSFAGPFLGLLIIALALGEHEANFAMALAVLIFTVVMWGVSKGISARIKSALTLWLINKQLYRKTAAALAEAHRANVLANERKQTELEARAASEAKTQFLATMSHELRTPLNAIVGFSEAMQQEVYGPIADKYRQYVAHIHQSGVALSDLVSDLLELSRIELGQHSLELSTVRVADLFEDVEKMFQQTPNRQLPNIRFNLAQSELSLNCDRRMVWQILINLVGNAVKFSPVSSTVQVDAERISGDRIRLRVRDSGIGIAQEDLGRITEAFVQGRDIQALAPSGVGLGLSLVKSFVELHDGALDIESRPDSGTTVTVELPVRHRGTKSAA